MAQNKRRLADYFAGSGSLAGGLRRRREEIEKGNIEDAPEAFRQGIKKEEAGMYDQSDRKREEIDRATQRRR
jgi:hypothetical protein